MPFLKLSKGINIFTIHDLRKIYFSSFFLNKLAFKIFFKYFFKKVDKIIVVSNSMKKEIQNLFGKIDIKTVYNTINPNDFKKYQKKV